MINPDNLFNQLRNLQDYIATKELSLLLGPIIKRQSAELLEIGSPSTGLVSSGGAPYASVSEYRGFIEYGDYYAVLFDASIIQLSYSFSRAKLIKHRLCYYPCPFDFDPLEVLEIPILDLIEYYQSSTSIQIRLRTPLRFDYDPEAANANHPISHLHMISEDCRLPVVAPIDFGRFIQFVFRHFYASKWREHRYFDELACAELSRTIAPAQERNFHLSFVASHKPLSVDEIF